MKKMLVLSGKFPINHKLLIYRTAVFNFKTDDYALIIYQNMSQEYTISSSDVLSFFQPKILAAIDYIWNVKKQYPDAEPIHKTFLEQRFQVSVKLK